MKSKTILILFSSLILTVGYLTSVTAVTDAELEALEKQIEQQEAEEIADEKREKEAEKLAKEKNATDRIREATFKRTKAN